MKKFLLYLATLTLLTLALTISAQASPITLADNTNESRDLNARSTNSIWRAQAFTTTATAYTLADVALWLYKDAGTTGTFELQIYDATGSNGRPGTFVRTVQTIDASTIITGASTLDSLLYDYPNLNIVLAPSTKYYLVNKGTALSGNIRWSNTTSTGGVGFPSDFSSYSAGSWSSVSQSSFQEMRIMASETSAVPEPPTHALLSLGLGGLVFWKRRQHDKAQ